MRHVLLVVVLFLVVWAGIGALEAKESEDLRVRTRVREYTEKGTGAPQRSLIVRELAGADPALAARFVREALVNEARRAPALELAARMRLPGVFDAARRHAESSAGPQVLALALVAPEDAAAAWVAERWTASEPGSERFRAVDEALRGGPCAAAVVAAIGRALGDPVRGPAALAILRTQMAVDDACPEDLRARWDAAWARYVHEARDFPRDGEDLLAAPGWRLRTAQAVGRNLRIAARSVVDLAVLPLATQAGEGTIRLRVAPGDGEGAFVSLMTGAGDGGPQDLRLRCDGTSWFLVEGPPREGERVAAPCRAGVWSDVELRISDPKLLARPSTRDVRVVVDGTELRPSGGFWRLSSPPESLTVGASCGEGPTLLGGVTWRRSGR